jgi:hypothetical protein
MTRWDRLLLTTGILSVACFAYLAWFSGAFLTPGETLKPFDAHLLGYTPEQARAYLGALNPAATSMYLSHFRLWDTVFPALLTFTMCGVIWTRATGVRSWLRLILLIFPTSYLVMDYAENALVAELLVTGPAVTDDQIAQASRYTVLKWGLIAVSLALTLWAAVLAPRRMR